MITIGLQVESCFLLPCSSSNVAITKECNDVSVPLVCAKRQVTCMQNGLCIYDPNRNYNEKNAMTNSMFLLWV